MADHREFAVSLALKAGEIMKQNFVIAGMNKDWKEDNSPLTITDLTINELVITSVKKQFPDHGIIAEEGSCFNGEEFAWICDPVDGTYPFSHGYPLFTFSLALTRDGYPELGLLYDVMLNRLVVAESGKGTYLNDKPVKVSESSSLSRSLIALEDGDPRFYGLRKELIDKDCLVTTFACITYSSLLVALGEFKAAMWFGKTSWDAAAVQIIIEEAGGICTDMTGSRQRYNGPINGLIASNKHLHPILLKMVRDSLAGK